MRFSLAATLGAAVVGAGTDSTLRSANPDLLALPEAMSRAGDEDVFEGRLADGDRIDLARKLFDQASDPFVTVRLLQTHATVDDRRGAPQPLGDGRGEL